MVEQGSILDRIDYNTKIASENVKSGLNHVENSLEIEKSERASNCQYFLISAIVVCLIILVLRQL